MSQLSNRRNVTRQRRTKSRSRRMPDVTALSYSGSLRTPAEQTVIMDLLQDTAVVSSAGGVLSDVLSDIPTGSPDWASAQALFAEYRVLAMSVDFIPNIDGGNVAATLYAPYYVVWDATSAAVPLASYTAAVNYPISKHFALNRPWSLSHKMTGVEEATFVALSSVVVDYTFKTFATGLTASTPYGRLLVRWKVQFRGRL